MSHNTEETTTYQVRHGRYRQDFNSCEEAEKCARELVDPSSPNNVEVVEYIDGEYSEHVLTLHPNC